MYSILSAFDEDYQTMKTHGHIAFCVCVVYFFIVNLAQRVYTLMNEEGIIFCMQNRLSKNNHVS